MAASSFVIGKIPGSEALGVAQREWTGNQAFPSKNLRNEARSTFSPCLSEAFLSFSKTASATPSVSASFKVTQNSMFHISLYQSNHALPRKHPPIPFVQNI